MALETSTLVNGAWTTMTLDVNSVLQHYEQQDKEANAKLLETESAPVYGLLSQTVIRSPVVHWILPVKLRSVFANDVAFIGDDFVQIRELRPDGHLCDIIRKENFGSRIRNARVVGSMKTYSRELNKGTPGELIKDEVDMETSKNSQRYHPGRTPSMPPQFILLQLSSGYSVFLMLRQSESGEWDFIVNRHRLSKPMLDAPQPGMHLAVDPSSRYMAIGGSEGRFSIHALYSRYDLEKQYSQSSDIRYIESERYLPVRGVIHKMEFLYPSADDEGHIILLLLIIRGGKTRMLLYEWQTGGDLIKISAHSQKGHLLEESRRMPLLLIPLTIKSAFILVSERSMAICQDILLGTPICIDFNDQLDPPTPYHHGLGLPLWTSWTRPIRLPHHTAIRDDIYIAREDGHIKFLEIDSEELINADMNIGYFDCNNGTALASLDYEQINNSDRTGDLLITGGDSCDGGTYLVRARKAPVFVQTVPNWSQSIDFVTTAQIPSLDVVQPQHHKELIPKPDRLFVCNGKGKKGAITEFRYGLEASIGLEVEYDTPIMRAWVLSPFVDTGTLFLLALGDRSALLSLSSDATEIEEVDEGFTPFDLESRTITAGMYGTSKIQVTERTIVVINGSSTHIHGGESLLGSANLIDDAVIYENVIFFTTHLENRTHLRVLASEITYVHDDQMLISNANVRTMGIFALRVTCLAACLVDQSLCAVIASWCEDSITLTFQPINKSQNHSLTLPTRYSDRHICLDAFVSIAVCRGLPGNITLLCGTRNGFVVTLEILESTLQIARSRCDKFGVTPANIKRDDSSGCQELFFVCCDSKVFALTPEVKNTGSVSSPLCGSRRTDRIWLTDAANPTLQQPDIVSVARLPNLSDGTEGRSLLVIAGNHLLLARLTCQSKAIPRNLSIGGSPSRLLYSHSLGVLIAAASVGGKSTLLFIDPNTGVDISRPVDKSGQAVDFVSGLGNANERIFALLEWPYLKDGKTWQFIIVCTSIGRLLIISTEKEEDSSSGALPGLDLEAFRRESGQALSVTGPKIRFWTRHKFKCQQPVYSVIGFQDGLFYCSGNTLYCETLNLAEKRFRKVAEYELPSPALSLSHENGNIHALTKDHSLIILKKITDRGTTKIIDTHSAELPRRGLHHLDTGLDRPISLISDTDCSITGLWATYETKSDSLKTVFEAELRHAIVRFRTGRCRPFWDPGWRRVVDVEKESIANNQTGASQLKAVADEPFILGTVPSSKTGGEILGLAINGSLSHFTILDVSAWRFLRFLMNVAIHSPSVAPFTHHQFTFALEPSLEPKTMLHVDGDILKHCLDERRLEEILRIGQDDDQEAAGIYLRFYELLQGIHGGRLEKDAAAGVYLEQAYADLEFYLRPVL